MKPFATVLLVAGIAAGAEVRAGVSATDLQVAARALSFMEAPLVGTVRVGILHSPSDARSAQDAEALRTLLGGGMRVGSIELRAVMVPVGSLEAAEVDLLFITEHSAALDPRFANAIALKRVPCVTTDLDEVRDGKCLMGVRSRPKVEILVNRAVAEASGVKFATVFRVMITET
jgi:hypothetical protein